MAGQLIASLSILVVLHEMGHFLPARWFGCRVEKFYLFFDPWFELFKKKIGETEYGIGWLPLGGYVKISGMVDESLDMEQLESEPQPWEFRSKPAWQRLIIMLGGVTVNFILGFAIFAGMLWYWGREYVPVDNVPQGVYADSLGRVYGLRNGDVPLRIDTTTLRRFDDLVVKNEILLRGARTLTVLRDGREAEIVFPDSLQRKLTSREYQALPLFSLPVVPRVDTIIPGGPAASSDLRKGDLVRAVDGASTPFFRDLQRALRAKEAGQDVTFTVLRSGREVPVMLTLNEQRRVGFGPDIAAQFPTVTETYGFFESIPAGVREGISQIRGQVNAFGQMFAGKINARESVGSVVTIGRAFGGTWDWYRFWRLTGLLSLILAIMNLLPIPALDGGHVMFLLYEVITGRKPGDKFLQYATTVGAVVLMAFMALLLANDIAKLF